MRILFVAPDFYNYHNEIMQEMRLQGYQVTFFAERPVRLVYSIVKRIGGKFARATFDYYLSTVLRKIESESFDRIVLIRGEIVDSWFVDELRLRFPDARFLLYQWDSLRVVDYRKLLPLFDAAATFDPLDASELAIEYIPLFYTQTYSAVRSQPHHPVVDLAFVASYHKNRYEVLCAVKDYCLANGIALDSYLYISPLDFVKLLFTNRPVPRLSHVSFRKLSVGEIVQKYIGARGILDIENERQAGLTIRSFEALATGRYLVTTNSRAMTLLPELSQRIVPLNRGDISIPVEVLRSASAPTLAIEKYSLRSWVQRLMAL